MGSGTGLAVGSDVGSRVGPGEGAGDGTCVGVDVGGADTVGAADPVGAADGLGDGAELGADDAVGTADGVGDGSDDGSGEGCAVGACVVTVTCGLSMLVAEAPKDLRHVESFRGGIGSPRLGHRARSAFPGLGGRKKALY